MFHSFRRRRPSLCPTPLPLRLHPQGLLSETDRRSHLCRSPETTWSPTHSIPHHAGRICFDFGNHGPDRRRTFRVQFPPSGPSSVRRRPHLHHRLVSSGLVGRHPFQLGRRRRSTVRRRPSGSQLHARVPRQFDGRQTLRETLQGPETLCRWTFPESGRRDQVRPRRARLQRGGSDRGSPRRRQGRGKIVKPKKKQRGFYHGNRENVKVVTSSCLYGDRIGKELNSR